MSLNLYKALNSKSKLYPFGINNFETLLHPKPKYLKISSPNNSNSCFVSFPVNIATEFLFFLIIFGYLPK